MLVSAITARVSEILQDDVSQTTWTAPQLLQWVNDAIRAVTLVRPDSTSVTASVLLVAGTLQTLTGANDLRLIRVIRNMGSAGNTPGNAIRIGDMPAMDLLNPGWHITLPYQQWDFTNTADNWTVLNGTLTPGATDLLIIATLVDLNFISPVLSFDGGTHRYIIAKIKRTATTTWTGQCFYNTAGHGYSEKYTKTIIVPSGIDADYVYAVWDMHNLTNGDSDWRDNTITSIRLDFSDAIGAAFSVDLVAVSATATLATPTVITEYMYDDTRPKEFWVYPPAAVPTYVQLSKSVLPTAVTAVGDTLPVDDIYGPAVIEWCCYRAFSRDSEETPNWQRAARHFSAFFNLLQVKVSADMAINPNVRARVEKS